MEEDLQEFCSRKYSQAKFLVMCLLNDTFNLYLQRQFRKYQQKALGPPNTTLCVIPCKTVHLKNMFVCCRKLGLDLVPRQGANMVEPDSMSVVELYHVHVSSAENTHSVSVSSISATSAK